MREEHSYISACTVNTITSIVGRAKRREMTSITTEGEITSRLTEIVNRKVKSDRDNDNSLLKHSRTSQMTSEELSGKSETRPREEEKKRKNSWRQNRKRKRHGKVSQGGHLESAQDMSFEGSCRRNSVAPGLFWTSVFLLSLACGINSISEEHIRRERSATDLQTYTAADLQALNLIREFIQRRHQQQYQQSSSTQMSNNGDGLSEGLPDIEKVRLPLLIQAIMAGYNDESKEETKRGSYMALCHFKICNMGRKRSGLKYVQRYRK